MNETGIWILIALCLAQSAVFSGLNLAVFNLSRLRIEALAERGDPGARRMLGFRRDSNLTLVTILWGNVATNALLALLSNSLLAGAAAFLFSTVVITLLGEIIPQAWFSRHALVVVRYLAPVLWIWRIVLFPVAKPVALVLDALIGREAIRFFGEEELRDFILHHAREGPGEIGAVEARGAVNFLALDDLPARAEGEPIDPRSILPGLVSDGHPAFPPFERTAGDPLLRSLAASGKKWVILTGPDGEPCFVVNALSFLRDALFGGAEFSAVRECRRPLVVRDPDAPLGGLLQQLKVRSREPGDDVIDEDLVLVWGPGCRRIITGSDVLGRLLRGIARPAASPPAGPGATRSG
ncbi:MAG: DUF21 domain-containing protein [Candidatus Brocadiae bacterium]|nr:DUF21 domain-containing protein [Candidatus Brocadiia bacterium]